MVIPDGDVLLHAGDFTNVGLQSDVEQFVQFLKSLPHRHKIVIAGNHDISFEKAFYEENWKKFRHKTPVNHHQVVNLLQSACTYLCDEQVTLNNHFTIYGSPWQPEFFNWGCNLPRGKPLRDKWQAIPQCDILITHGPPLGTICRSCICGLLFCCVDLRSLSFLSFLILLLRLFLCACMME